MGVNSMEKEYNVAERLLTRDTDLLWRTVGPLVRLAGKTAAGRLLMSRVGKLSGMIIANTGMFGMEKMEEPADVMREWTKVLDDLGCNYELGGAGEDEAELFMIECPAGLTESDGREVCLMGMSADRELVRRLGGELVIGETIASGADRCCLKVVRATGG